MNSRMDALGMMDDHDKAFKLDITEYKDTSSAKDFLSSGFEEQYKYPVRSFVFFPRQRVY